MAYTVLVIDGDRDSRELLRLVLSHRGHEVLVADTAAAGLSLARSCAPTGVITEFLVPARGGRCVVEALRCETKTRKLPVMVWTATGLPEVRERIEKAGGLFRMKPAHPLELVVELEELIERQQAENVKRARSAPAAEDESEGEESPGASRFAPDPPGGAARPGAGRRRAGS